MKYLASLCMLCFLSGCEKKTDTKNPSRSVSVGSCQELSPRDLGIDKKRFVAFPDKQEVAIFRSRVRSLIEPQQNRTYDQIHWTNGSKDEHDVVITPLSFYRGYPDDKENGREESFRNSWRLQAGGFGYDIKEYTFIGSNWSSSSERATGEVVYTKNNVTKSEDLVFQFELFVIPISEAKRIHPELGNSETKMEDGTISWQAAYLLNEEADQAAPRNR